MQPRQRTLNQMLKYAPMVRDIPFFKDRELKDQAMAEILSLFKIHKVPKSQFVFEYGTFGTEFYFILDGTVEILLPHEGKVD